MLLLRYQASGFKFFFWDVPAVFVFKNQTCVRLWEQKPKSALGGQVSRFAYLQGQPGSSTRTMGDPFSGDCRWLPGVMVWLCVFCVGDVGTVCADGPASVVLL